MWSDDKYIWAPSFVQVESGPTIEAGAFSLVDEHLERDKLTAAPGASDSVVSEVEARS